MDDATLARLEHENMREWLRVSCAQVRGALIESTPELGIYATGLPVALFNQIVTDDGATPADLTRAVERVRERGTRFYPVLRRGTDDALRPTLEAMGLPMDDGTLPGMALHPIPPELPAAAEGLDIRVIADASGLRDHAIAAGVGFGLPEAMAVAFMGEELWARPGATVYVGYADGEPVATGFGVRSGRTIGVFTIATVPAARGRGFGAAMTGRVVADGAAAGCDVATLQASAMGRPIYERMGFRLVQEYDIYLG
jgi:GNAT superfamily N-acetyltransferase